MMTVSFPSPFILKLIESATITVIVMMMGDIGIVMSRLVLDYY